MNKNKRIEITKKRLETLSSFYESNRSEEYSFEDIFLVDEMNTDILTLETINNEKDFDSLENQIHLILDSWAVTLLGPGHKTNEYLELSNKNLHDSKKHDASYLDLSVRDFVDKNNEKRLFRYPDFNPQIKGLGRFVKKVWNKAWPQFYREATAGYNWIHMGNNIKSISEDIRDIRKTVQEIAPIVKDTLETVMDICDDVRDMINIVKSIPNLVKKTIYQIQFRKAATGAKTATIQIMRELGALEKEGIRIREDNYLLPQYITELEKNLALCMEFGDELMSFPITSQMFVQWASLFTVKEYKARDGDSEPISKGLYLKTTLTQSMRNVFIEYNRSAQLAFRTSVENLNTNKGFFYKPIVNHGGGNMGEYFDSNDLFYFAGKYFKHADPRENKKTLFKVKRQKTTKTIVNREGESEVILEPKVPELEIVRNPQFLSESDKKKAYDFFNKNHRDYIWGEMGKYFLGNQHMFNYNATAKLLGMKK